MEEDGGRGVKRAMRSSFGRAATSSTDIDSTSSKVPRTKTTSSIELTESRRVSSDDGSFSNEALDSTLDEECLEPFVRTQCTLTGAKRDLYQHVNNLSLVFKFEVSSLR